MQDELSKIDMIRERMDISYREAKKLLDEADGDLVEALVRAEALKERGWTDRLVEAGQDLAGQVKTYIDKGNETKVKFKQGDKTLFEVPATLGVLGVAAALASTELAVVAGIGAMAAIANKVSLEVQKPDGETKVVSLDRHREKKDDPLD